MKANLVKILSQPAAQSFADEVTECLIGLGASERAFRAISKSKEPRRKYVSAPSEASLKRANFSKRTAEKMSSSRSTVIKVELEGFKRRKIGASHPETITYEGIVDMPSTDVANLVLQSLRTPLPAPLPPNVKLLLPPSELKMRIIQILSKIATPSSVFVIDVNNRRLRDPRRRRSKDELSAPVPLLLPIFDEVTLEEMAEWISQNASTIAEPPVSVSEDNLVQVYLKPVTQEWCREMAVGAVTRILENEYGTGIRGDGKLREQLMCRIACDRWLLNGNKLLGDKLPSLYQVILDFCVEDLSARSSLIVTLMYHEYVQSVKKLDMGEYSKLVCSILQALMKNLDLTVSGNKKNFGYVLSHIPLITVSIVKIIQDLFTIEDGSGIVLGITSLRDIVKERKNCGAVALNLLLRYTCADAESCRNSSIRCVANQLYTIEDLKASIENHAIHLVKSLKSVRDVASDQKLETILSPLVMPSDAIPSMFASAMKKVEENYKNQEADLLYFAKEVLNECDLSKELDTDQEIIRRLDLFLALCAKKPALFGYLVSTYADSSDRVQQVMFTAIEKLVKHFKQRGSVDVVSYLYDFEERSLPFVCHVIQILCARAQPSEELVGKVLTLYREHDTVVDAVSVLIPILPDISSDEFFPLLPHLISLSSTRFSVALSKLLGGNSKVAPMNFLLALHHVDLKADVTMQKKVIEAINSCIEDHQYRAAFPSDVLLQVCRTLLEEDTVPKLSLRTLIQSVTVHPILQKEAVELLSILVDRSVWKMEDAIWKGFIKCSILVQPHSFPLLLQKLPVTELKKIFDKEPELHKALKDYVISQGEEELSALDEIDAEAKEDREEDMEDIPIEREEIKKQITKPLEIPSPVMELLGI
jgi:symplekin